MQDAPTAPTQATLTPDEVELVEDGVRFYPDSVARRIAGGPIGEVTIAGVRCTFRRASVRDIAALEKKMGMELGAALKLGQTAHAAMALMALTPIDGGTLPEDPLDIPWSDAPNMGTVLRFFLGPGTLVARSGEASPKTTRAESDGPVGS